MLEVAKLGHVALTTPNLDRSLAFYTELMGLDEVERRDGVVYLRAWGEFEHHSLSLREGPSGIDHIAWRARRQEDIAAFAKQLTALAFDVTRVEPGEEAGQGEAIRFTTPSEHPYEIYYDIEKPLSPPEIRSRMRNASARPWRRGASPRRLDHVNLTALDLDGAELFHKQALGFKPRERMRYGAGGPMLGTWMAVTSLAHDIAITAEQGSVDGRFHHLGFAVESYEDVMRAADIFRDAGLEIDLGPGMHGVARSFYLYLREPAGGHRVEVYAGGYHIFDPDWEPIEWCEPDELADGMTWYGERMVRGADGTHAIDSTLACTQDLAEVTGR